MKPSRPSIPPTLAAGIEVGGYVLGERIGCGGFGEVYAAHQPTIGRRVAIKVLHAQYSADPDAVKRFVDEARAVNRILHSGIVEIFDFGRVAGRGFFVMELIEGKSLRALLAERGHLPLVEALPLFRGIAEAVDAAHAAQIAHRDLKPDNVFVLPDGRTKLIDFGLAKLVRDRDAVTETGSVFGTPLYMSPEQCRGKAIDTRTDLYSFGVLVYHVLVGQPPFEGEPIELALKHLNERPQPPSERRSELSRNVDRVVLALLAKDPADRPPSLMAACGALAGSSTLRIRRTRQAKRAVLGIAGIALVAAGVAYEGSRDSSVGGPACRSGGDRIAIAWSPARSAGLASRFAEDGDRAVWRVASERLDAAAARWAAAWDRACTADVNIDALLHEQRKTCLENALVEFVATVDFFAHVEPASFSDDFDGDIVAPAFPTATRRRCFAPRPQHPHRRPARRSNRCTPRQPRSRPRSSPPNVGETPRWPSSNSLVWMRSRGASSS
ncbi:MAG: serine/threonine-protein kinase [Kofleriaceae bacterium]